MPKSKLTHRRQQKQVLLWLKIEEYEKILAAAMIAQNATPESVNLTRFITEAALKEATLFHSSNPKSGDG